MELSLVKYCKKEHVNKAVNKGQIFVGTFSKYQKIENLALRDNEEGAATPAVLDDEKELVICEADNETLLAKSSIKMSNGHSLKLPKGMPLYLDKPDFNTLIYCVSNDPEPSIDKAKRLGYESYFKITNPYNFGRALMHSIAQHFNSPFGVRGDMGPVNYVPRKLAIVNRSTAPIPDKSFCLADLFTKNECFSDDKEFRFVIMEYSNAERSEYSTLYTDGEIIENIEICKWIESP